MEVETETKQVLKKKVYKSPECVRKAMKKYEEKIRTTQTDQYIKRLEYHRNYYNQKKEELKRYKKLLEDHNIEINNI